MTEYNLQLYTQTEYAELNEFISFSAYASSASGTYALSDITDTKNFIVNFNDFKAENYVQTIPYSDFKYSYKTILTPATIQLSATINSVLYTNSFTFLQTVSSKQQQQLVVSRVNPQFKLKLPHPKVKIPTNDLAISDTFNQVVDKIYDNIEYIKSACKVYGPPPTQAINGWGQFDEYKQIECFQATSTTFTNISTYGILGETSNVIPLVYIPTSSYKTGTSFVTVVSTIPKDIISTTETLTSFYCSNLDNIAVQLLSTSDISLNDLPLTGTLMPYTHTLVDYTLKTNTGDNITPVLQEYKAINICSKINLIPVYNLSGAIIGTNYTYIPKTINWKLKDKFYYTSNVVSSSIDLKINDIIVKDKNLYIARGSFIEKYKIEFANKEMSFSTKTIDISETFTLAKSVAINSQNQVYMLDSTRHKVNIFEIDSTTGILTNINQWGSIGGVTAKQGFYKPNQLFISNDKIYICDTGNKCVKKYSINGNWEYTFTLPDINNETIISSCEKNGNIFIVTENRLITVSSSGDLIKNTPISFSSRPVKMVLNSIETFVYICCEKQVYRITFNHEIIDTFAELTSEKFPSIERYYSITVDDNSNIYLTDGNVLLKYIDIASILNIRNETIDNTLWSKSEIYIDLEEFVSDWVYNRSIRRLGENIELIFRSIEKKIRLLDKNNYDLEPLNDLDTGFYNGLPTSLSNLSMVGINEIVASEVLNRSISQLQNNLQYLVELIENKQTLNKSGFIENFTTDQVILDPTCWSWQKRTSDTIGTIWPETSLQNITWAGAQNYNNVVLLSGAKFTIPLQNSISLNNIENELTVSFWISAQQCNNSTPSNYFILGLDNTYNLNTGYAVEANNGEFVLNINGNKNITTTGSIVSNITGSLTHVAFAKKNTNCVIYVNGQVNNTIGTAPAAPARPALRPLGGPTPTVLPVPDPQIILDTFSFGTTDLPASSFVGFLHDIWIFNKQISQSDIQSLYNNKQITSNISPYARNSAISRWFGNSTYVWLDIIGNSNATIISGSKTLLKDFLGNCCE